MTLTCSNIQGKIRALGLIPSNLQVNYHIGMDALVISMKGEQVLARSMSSLREG